MRVRFARPPSVIVYVGPWACRYSWVDGTFDNGSRWSSGWHRWAGTLAEDVRAGRRY